MENVLSKNGQFPLYVKQGKFKVGVVPADGLGHLQQKSIFCINLMW
jgi:hypothetical protein